MKKIARCYSMILASAIVVCASLATDASAQATQVPIAGIGFPTGPPFGGTSFTSGRILHVRDSTQIVFLVAGPGGGLTGWQTVTLSLDQDVLTKAGRVHGVQSFTGTHMPSGRNGSFEGTFVGDIVPNPSVPCGGIINVTSGGQSGTDGFAGMKRFFDAVNTCFASPPIIYGGYILDPSGQLQP
jgi:hypothetical protein